MQLSVFSVPMRRILALTTALLLAVAGDPAFAGTCPERGFLDAPASTEHAVLPRIDGWVWSSARITEVRVRDGERGERGRRGERRDHGVCGNEQRGADANSLGVEARTADGRVLEIGTSAMDLSEPFGVVENNGPIAQSAESSVHGWAISALGDLKVSVLAGDVELATGFARSAGTTSQPRMQRSAPASICRCRFAPCREGAIS